LATRDGIAFVLGFLVGSGAMCPECGHGTRATSKHWATCKKCGRKVARNAETLKRSVSAGGE
jgi:tRNA(Ile2) C34 agmatinyltransferase TiaS